MDRASLTPAQTAEVDRGIRPIVEPELLANPDPENRYLWATDMAYCGEKDMALRLLKSAIEGRYCIYDALQKDPLVAPLRGTPEYPQLLSAAKQCKDNFARGASTAFALRRLDRVGSSQRVRPLQLLPCES